MCAIYIICFKKADFLFIKNVFQLMYYASTVYTVERTRLTTHLMIYSMRTWAIVRNPPPFNNTPVLANPVYYNRCIKPSWELSIKSIFCCITKSLVLLIKRKLIRLHCTTHQIAFIFINDKTVEINCFQVAVYFEASSLK